MLGAEMRGRIAYFLRGHWSRRPLSWWDISRAVLSALTLLFAVYFVASAGVGIWQWTLLTRQAEADYQELLNHNRQQAAGQLAQSCAISGAPRDLIANCLAEQVDKYRQRDTTDADLLAQQEMARWTFAMGVTAVLGLPLSLAGLVAVYLSLGQTRRAIQTDREIGEAQVRAYIAVEPKQPTSITSTKLVASTFEFRNTGQSPARRVRYIAGIIIAPYPLPHDQGDLFVPADGQRTPSLTLAPGPPITGEAKAPHLFAEQDIKSAMGGGSERVYLGGAIWYEDVFGKQRQTRFCYYLDESDEEPGPREKAMGMRLYNWHQAHVHNDET